MGNLTFVLNASIKVTNTITILFAIYTKFMDICWFNGAFFKINFSEELAFW